MIKRFFNFLSILLGIGFIVAGVYLAINNPGEKPIFGIIDIRSFGFVFLILLGIALNSYGIANLLRVVWLLITISPYRAVYQVDVLNKNLKRIADVYYREGVSRIRSNIPFRRILPVWRVVIEQLEINLPIRDIKDLLHNDGDNFRLKISLDVNILANLSAMAPSIGVMGTVLGLIRLLANMKDVSTIGTNMSLALMTTLYGIFLGTILLKPLSTRLELIRDAYMNSYRQALFWLDLIEERKPAFYIEEKYNKKSRRN